MINTTCSNCGTSYGARRIHADANYCGASCKQKAYRKRKAHLKKVMQGTFSESSRDSVHDLDRRYGQRLSYMLNRMYSQYGGKALEMAIEIAEYVDLDDPDDKNSKYE